ncbi:glycosyltransferase family 59 protein [Lentithecium fluviatile CBS 122367]|uniref:Dol-P-Glc:Glc(2)Man(9)GlcNAc(2)-PP-Dol alpha-1,2-glucosyltransferase n=1 Tax=Lentithecium fluviatile CBS 122367 TaxID=1168545 RepID=A0A6G1JL37_9PLEO|nr:glycosyltransferase family 59 protein [Lentithecium fluviatile CBS 122367]
MSSLLQVWALPAALLAIANISATWYNLVQENVLEPYLDEFFHVPQAQRYCNKDYTYLVSLLFRPVAGCETSSLRALNVGAIALICLVTYHLFWHLRDTRSANVETKSEKEKQTQASSEDQASVFDAHSALNISLFPPLFFFSALYYTDVMSTLAVLLSYHAFLTRRNAQSHLIHSFKIVVVGVFALLFRQTNVFWVAVFPAGLAAVDVLTDKKENADQLGAGVQSVVQNAWDRGQIYDVSVGDAGPQDFVLFLLTVALAAAKKPLPIFRVIVPYLIILALFAGFVVWNDGVVLGDKSAHIATIHLPQMLYFWPYIIFFSVPLTLSSVLSPIVQQLSNGPRAFCSDHLTGEPDTGLPSILSTTLFLLCGLAAVHFNTIVHPYTLADNRHYVFYAFRILRRHPTIKYLAVPFYFICAWLAIRTLRSPSGNGAQAQGATKSKPTTKKSQPCNLSFIIVWVATTTLSVATAPLVEPRYFIVPWIMWRLHVPYVFGSSSRGPTKKASYDARLILETIWLLAIDVAIGYNFLYRGFSWPSEPGIVQRFLW